MDRYDRQILAFVLAWAPYEGPRDDDTFPEFGLSAERLSDRFSQIVAATIPRSVGLDSADRDLLARAWEYERSRRAPKPLRIPRYFLTRQTGTDRAEEVGA